MRRRIPVAAMLSGLILLLSCAGTTNAQPVGGTAAPPPDLPANGSNAFTYCDDYYPGPDSFSYFTVDLLILRPDFDRNPALFSNGAIAGVGAPGTIEFDTRTQVVPRLNFNFQFAPLWGVRASWWGLAQGSSAIQFANDNPGLFVRSVEPLGTAEFSAKQTVTIDTPTLSVNPNSKTTTTSTVPGRFLVQSPQSFFFLPLLPNETIDPADGIVPIPPFPFGSAVAAGFPDLLTFRSWLKMNVFDFDVCRYIEIGKAYGALNMGVRYAYISQSYYAHRENVGGARIVPGWDPFLEDVVGVPDPARLTVREDRRDLFYGHNFRGVGPKAMFNLVVPAGGSETVKLYSKFGGSVILGNRKERAFVNGAQRVILDDTFILADGTEAPDFLGYSRTFSGQAERDHFTVIPMGEVEAGISFHLGNGISPIINVGVIGQYWVGAGNATNPNANLFLYGGNVTFGFRF